MTNIRRRFSIWVAMSALLVIAAVAIFTGDAAAQGNVHNLATDKAALKALYDDTDGANWSNKSGWDFNQPLDSSWHGVTVSGNRVTELDLSENNLNGSIPAKIGDLTALTKLNLFENSLNGSIPSELGQLTQLTELTITDNLLTGSIPSELGQLTNLEYLLLTDNQLSGVIPKELGNLQSLISLALRENRLTGDVPRELGQLSNVEILAINGNLLTGTPPAELGNLSKMWALDLSDNAFSGLVPSGLANAAVLSHLFLGQNDFEGPLPASLANASKLTFLYVNATRVCLPSSLNIWYQNLQTRYPLTLPSCVVPAAPSNLSAAAAPAGEAVILTWDATTDTSVDGWETRYRSSGDFTEWTDVPGSDGLTTSATIGGLLLGVQYTFEARATNYTGNGAVSSVNGSPAVSEVDKAALKALYDATNGANWTKRTYWDFTSALDANWYGVSLVNGRVSRLNLSDNGLNGSLPSALSDLANLRELNLSNNSLRGGVPASFSGLSVASNVDFSGTLLCASTADSGLQDWLDGLDNLSPSSLRDCAVPSAPSQLVSETPDAGESMTLTWNDLGDYTVSKWQTRWQRDGGQFSDWSAVANSSATTTSTTISDLPSGYRYTFEVRAVNFTGEGAAADVDGSPFSSADRAILKIVYDTTGGPDWIDADNWDFSKALTDDWHGIELKKGRVVTVSLGDNNLKGGIPVELSGLTELEYLNLSRNRMRGGIPAVLGNLSKLEDIYLGNNQLTGSIPPELGNLSNLQWLWAGNNDLSGPLPPELGKLTALRSFNVERNDLTGPIPPEYGNLVNLERWHINTNKLSGSLPHELGNLSSLSVLYAWINKFSGELPPRIGNYGKTYQLLLSENDFTGRVPSEWKHYRKMLEVGLRNNSVCLGDDDPELISWIKGRAVTPAVFPECHDGDDDGLIEVDNVAQLNAIRWDLNGDGAVDDAANRDAYEAAFPEAAGDGACPMGDCHGYELGNDINLNQESWMPIGDLASGKWDATFRGNGHTISHLKVKSTVGHNVGLFGETTHRSVIEGVHIYSADAESYGGNNDDNRQNSAGALVGFNRGIVRESGLSYIWGDICKISGRNVSGGLVGGNEGIVERSWSNCDDINSKKAGGGLVGFNHPGGIVRDSWADGLVIVKRKGWKKGALIGRNFGTVERSFSLGQTRRDKTYHGPLTGQQGGVVTDSYFVGHGYDEKYGGEHLKDEDMRTPRASHPGFFADWDRQLWHLGDRNTYSALVVDANHDGIATPWEMGPQRPSDSVNGKPVKVGDPAITRTKLTLQFRAPDGNTAALAAVHYRIAARGWSCTKWFGSSTVLLGRSDERATLTVTDDGLYTLEIDRLSDEAFQSQGRVCVDVNFLNTEGKGYRSSQRWRDIHMPAMTPVSSFHFSAPPKYLDSAIEMELTLNPGNSEFSEIDGFYKSFKDEHGNNCHNPAYAYEGIGPEEVLRGSDADDGVVKIWIPYAGVPGNRAYCLYVQAWNEDGTERVRRWTKVDVPDY